MKAKFLKIFVPIAGLAACGMRIALYATGFDGRSLLIQDHWARIGLLILTGLVAVILLATGLFIKGSDNAKDARPKPFPSALGCFAAAMALGFTCGWEFGDFPSVLHTVLWGLGLVSTFCLLAVSVCRWQRSRPYFALHAIVCVYFALRTVLLYRSYSSDPMTQDYTFYLMAYVALMLCAYHHAAFDAGMGSHRALWITSLAAVYLCCAALKNCPDIPLLAGCALWALTNLTSLTVRRPVRPRQEQEEEIQ